MPELRRVQLGLRVRHGYEALAHPTEQQRIDHAAAAAARAAKVRRADELDFDAEEEAEQHGLGPSKRRKLGDKPAAVAAAAGQQGGKAGRKGAAAGAGQLQKWGSGAAAAAAAAAVGSGDEAGSGRAGRKRQGAVQTFIKGVNKGKAYDVRQAQNRARADKAAAAAAAAGGALGAGRGWGRGPMAQASKQGPRAAAGAAAAAEAGYYEDQHDAMDWEAQDDFEPAAAAAQSVGQQRQHEAQHAGVRLGRHHRLGLQVQPVRYDRQLMLAKLHCRLVVLPKEGQRHPQRQQDIADVSHTVRCQSACWHAADDEGTARAVCRCCCSCFALLISWL